MCVVQNPLDFISRKTEELGEGTEGERKREREGGRDMDGGRREERERFEERCGII